MSANTVKVRIAVAVTSEGEWFPGGYQYKTAGKLVSLSDEQASGNAVDGLDSAEYAVHFIEAEVPLPVSETVQGKVSS